MVPRQMIKRLRINQMFALPPYITKLRLGYDGQAGRPGNYLTKTSMQYSGKQHTTIRYVKTITVKTIEAKFQGWAVFSVK